MIKEAVDLFQLLTEKEQQSFTAYLKTLKNGNLLKTFNLLIHADEDKIYDKTVFFESLFSKAYSQQKDFLLRNELRLLRKVYQRFLGELYRTDDAVALDFLKALADRGRPHQFIKAAAKEERKWKKKEAHYCLNALSKLKFQFIYKRQFQVTETRLQEMHHFLVEGHRRLKTDTLIKEKELAVHDAFLRYSMQRLGASSEDLQSLVGLESYNTPFEHFLEIKKGTYSLIEQERLNTLEEGIAFLENLAVTNNTIDANREQLVMANNLALEYFFRRDYANAVRIYNKIVNSLEVGKHEMIYYNYASALMKSGQYESCLETLDDFLTHVSEAVLKSKTIRIKTMTYVLLGKFELAKSLVPVNWRDSSGDDYYYLRLVMCILFYRENKIELSIRECTNILQSIGGDSQFEIYQFAAQRLKTMLTTKSINVLTRIYKEVKWRIEDTSIRHGDVMPMIWMQQELEKRLEL